MAQREFRAPIFARPVRANFALAPVRAFFCCCNVVCLALKPCMALAVFLGPGWPTNLMRILISFADFLLKIFPGESRRENNRAPSLQTRTSKANKREQAWLATRGAFLQKSTVTESTHRTTTKNYKKTNKKNIFFAIKTVRKQARYMESVFEREVPLLCCSWCSLQSRGPGGSNAADNLVQTDVPQRRITSRNCCCPGRALPGKAAGAETKKAWRRQAVGFCIVGGGKLHGHAVH